MAHWRPCCRVMYARRLVVTNFGCSHCARFSARFTEHRICHVMGSVGRIGSVLRRGSMQDAEKGGRREHLGVYGGGAWAVREEGVREQQRRSLADEGR
eukprot:6199941-Pleurochrysis_carterae.AAC.3